MKKIRNLHLLFVLTLVLYVSCSSDKTERVLSFNSHWKFFQGDAGNAMVPDFDDSSWSMLNVPHDWSIEGEFSAYHPATPGGGALPGGIGWYRKSFSISKVDSGKLFFIDFDGVYCNSEVWINGHYLGIRPFGYSSFRYELTPYLNYGEKENIIAVKVDNSKQPNSRWYSGSGIYRNVWLVCTDRIFVDHWGTFITTPLVKSESADVVIETIIKNTLADDKTVSVITAVLDNQGKKVTETSSEVVIKGLDAQKLKQELTVKNPQLWSVNNPALYTAVTTLKVEGKTKDRYETPFGIRYFSFDAERGFLLNGKKVKINGVCNHHDLGCLGAAINTRALERQLEILKDMGCNGIRTSHNPPAPELLDLCDKMGFIVMDEAFDMWKKGKSPYDYSLYFDEWHKRDLQDLILRDRNHPSVIIWSIGNEILEQRDTSGVRIALELTALVREIDTTRPITSGCNEPNPWNNIIKSGALDLIGYNYHHHMYEDFPKTYPGQKFISAESVSGLATRGSYDMPSDSVRRWPVRWDLPLTTGNADFSCSSYDNCSAPWGSTHAETWRVMKKHDYLSGMFIWTGWDYLGEPTPYSWPARSSYFGIIDLAGFPKDIFYFYQSEWTNKPVLHIFPHWNWNTGDTIDIWAYTNFSEVELFLNDASLGKKVKSGDDLHLSWRVAYQPGTIRAIATKKDTRPFEKVINTAGEPVAIMLEADRNTIKADGSDLSFVTVKIVDADGNLVPYADNLVNFQIAGEGFIAGVDNGSQISHEPFKADYRKAFNGMCLVVIQSNGKKGKISLQAASEGLKETSIELTSIK